ncbi:MAG: amino acid ABC transporter permease [Erysipelotrichaceae bacterium]|nr:amino acid ABC transporter permease [Erysipelotrichaceae bacterium]MDD6093298.1 amino acid ABC transporter permease [bacterium]MDY3934424.1 amino acid ABC transporter permease [Bacilli bacterium]
MNGIVLDFYKTVIYDDRYMMILEGLKNTILIALGSIVIGILLGLLIAIVRDMYEKNGKGLILNKICKIYVDVIRGTPALLQLMIIYYVIFKSVSIDLVLVGILAFGLNSSAYVSEIIRAGINSIDVGQMEAAKSLGFKYFQSMRYIILPQAIKNVLPALGNEFITLVKETSVAGYIGIMELTKSTDMIASRTYNYFFPLIIAALIYLGLTMLLTKLLNRFERKVSNA